MKVPLRWLGEWADLPSLETLARRLSLGGLLVDEIERRGPDLSAARVGRVVERSAHPNADRLSLCRVDLGDGEPVAIVCGAPNVEAGQTVAVVSPGSSLPDGTEVKRAKIRGVTSHGMICSERELGLGAEDEGILVLDSDAPPGSPLSDVIEAGETVLDIEITPNRGDCVSMLGIAREVRAHFGGALRLPPCAPREGARPAAADVRIEIEDGERCHRYAGRVVRGARDGPSPDWLRRKLEAADVRSISTVVDVTNLVMLEFGQPLHAFDLAKLAGGEIRVRRAASGERLCTLDGQLRELSTDDLVIADADEPIALAGVMGGAATEVTAETRDVLIEAAQFLPSSVRRTARRHGLPSESSYRFERGVDPEGVERAAARAALLIAELAGGEVSAGAVVALGDPPPGTSEILLDPARVNRLLGTEIPADEVRELLARVEIDAIPERQGLRCQVPTYRTDLHRYQDLIEEVARIWGYDRIPTTTPAAPLQPILPRPLQRLIERVQDCLCAAGLIETMTFPVLAAGDLDGLRLPPDDPRRATVGIQNPLVEGANRLSSTPIPALLHLLRQNRSRQVDRVRVFQVGHVFAPRAPNELPDEPCLVAALVTRGQDAHLWEPRDPVPLFFEIKGIAERMMEAAGADATFRGGGEPYLHPGACNEIAVAGRRVGVVGELHPEVARHFEIDCPAGLFEVDLGALSACPPGAAGFREVSRHPSTRRDIAVLLDERLPAGEVLEAIRKTAGPHLMGVELFDRYEGEGIPEGQVSLAFRMVFQRPDRTLKDQEVNKLVDRVVQMLASRFGGEQR